MVYINRDIQCGNNGSLLSELRICWQHPYLAAWLGIPLPFSGFIKPLSAIMVEWFSGRVGDSLLKLTMVR